MMLFFLFLSYKTHLSIYLYFYNCNSLKQSHITLWNSCKRQSKDQETDKHKFYTFYNSMFGYTSSWLYLGKMYRLG